MIEALIAGKPAKAITLPLSGPGSKTLLFGTEELGYFGRVTQDELFTGQEVNDLAGMTVGVVGPVKFDWMKFVLKGKIIFIASQPLRINVSWVAIYEAGCVYGVNGVGPYPSANPTNQFKWKMKPEGNKKWFLKIRSIKGSDIDPYPETGDYTSGSEYNQLIGRMITGSHSNAGVWESNPPADIGADRPYFTQETRADYHQNTLARGSDLFSAMYISSATKTSVIAKYGYRAVFELFDGSTLVAEPSDVNGRLVDGVDAPRTFTGVSTSDTVKRPQLVSGTLIPDINPPNVFTSVISDPILKPSAVNSSVDFKPSILSFTNV